MSKNRIIISQLFIFVSLLSDRHLRWKEIFHREISRNIFRMSNDFIDDDSLDLDLSDANHTSQLYNLNQRLLFKGYNSILDETGELNQKTLEETLDKLLQRDSQLLKVKLKKTDCVIFWISAYGRDKRRFTAIRN